MFVFGANHSDETPDMTEVTIPHIFLLMGQQINLIKEAGPGCIIGIGGLEDILLKTGTICSDAHCPNFSKIEGISVGLVKVAIEPNLLSQMQALRQGLTLMARADPSIEFQISKSGEFILSTCGEVHLEKCLKDLKDDYAPGIDFSISKPIIPFKETIINKSMRDRVFKVQVPWEELNSESESSSDEEVKEGQQPVLSLAEFIAKQEEMELARETLKKEQAMDMYIEKIFLMKIYRGDQKALDKIGFKKNCAEDLTAN